MKESVGIAKEADTKKGVSPTKSDNSIRRVRNEPERQLGSLRSVIDIVRRDGDTPSVDSIATEMSNMPTTQCASVLLVLQRTHGNRYVQRVVAGIQAKLKVGQQGDIYEQEADRVAEAVMRMSEPRVQRQVEEEEKKKKEEELIQIKSIADQTTPLVQRQIEEKKEEEEETFQAKEVQGHVPEVTPSLESPINTLRGGGQPLPEFMLAFFEPRFDQDFSNVRVHTDTRAAEAARAVNARAFTTGKDVIFDAGQYSPETATGKRLLAHELTHVVQQKNGRKTLRRQRESRVEKREYGEEYEEYAKLLKEAMEGWGTEEEQIFKVLQKVHGRSTAITSLKKAYKNKYGTSLEDDLRDEMSGSELDFALSLLGEKPSSKDVEIKPRTLREDDYTEAVDRLIDAIEGPGTDEELIYAVLVPFAGAFGSIRKLKAAYKHEAGNTLEDDLRDEMSGDELEYVLKLLHAPLKPAEGMPEKLLAEAKRETEPLGAVCTTASIKRWVRAYLDYHYLDGKLYAEAQGDLSPEEKTELTNTLKSLLGESLGERYLGGGPTGGNWLDDILNTLRHENLFGADEGRRLFMLWQIRPLVRRTPPHGHGAVEALDEPELGEKVTRPGAIPGTTEANIKDVLWNEILKPGAVIQTWSTIEAATTFKCPASKRLGESCGHSFIFVEYVYSSQESPSKDKPRSWPLYGGSGMPLNTGGEVDSVRKPLAEMKSLYLAGMRIIDQRGYHFIPKDSGNINNKVLPDNVPRVKWLAQSEFWVAAQLT